MIQTGTGLFQIVTEYRCNIGFALGQRQAGNLCHGETVIELSDNLLLFGQHNQRRVGNPDQTEYPLLLTDMLYQPALLAERHQIDIFDHQCAVRHFIQPGIQRDLLITEQGFDDQRPAFIAAYLMQVARQIGAAAPRLTMQKDRSTGFRQSAQLLADVLCPFTLTSKIQCQLL